MGVDLIAVAWPRGHPGGAMSRLALVIELIYQRSKQASPRPDPPDNPRDFKTPNHGMTEWEDLFQIVS